VSREWSLMGLLCEMAVVATFVVVCTLRWLAG